MNIDRLIDSLATDPTDRAALRELAVAMLNNPILEPRTESVLRELVRPAIRPDGSEYSPEESLQYAQSFMEATGIPADVAGATLGLIGDIDFDDVPTARIEDEALVAHVEQAMRNDPDRYARNPDAQDEYRAALERLSTPRLESGYWTDVDQRRVAEIETKHMRAPQGSQEWTAYWRGPLQGEYAELMQRKLAPPFMPEPEPEMEAE